MTYEGKKYTANSKPPLADLGSFQSSSDAMMVPHSQMKIMYVLALGILYAARGASSSIVPLTNPAGIVSNNEVKPV